MDVHIRPQWLLTEFARLGLRFEHHEDTGERRTLWISVPERSCRVDSEGVELSGKHLAKVFKSLFIYISERETVIKSRIRKDESWTDAMGKIAASVTAQILKDSWRWGLPWE